MSFEKILTWVKKHWIFTAIIFFVVPLLIIHTLFKLNSEVDFFVAEWTAGELLGYIAGFYAFIGTILLGAVTVEQSKRAQKTNEQLAKENIELQKVVAQNLLPIVKVSSVDVENSKKVNWVTIGKEGTVTVTRHTLLKGRKLIGQSIALVNVVLPNTTFDNKHVKTIRFSIENISEGIIREIKIERISFPCFKLCKEISCIGEEKFSHISCLLMPHEKIDIAIQIFFSDLRYIKLWEFYDRHTGAFMCTLYLKNTSMSDIEYREKIFIRKPEVFNEEVVYCAFEDNYSDDI